MKRKTIVPDELRFAVTRKCNGACRHCYNNSGYDTRELSAGEFVHILREAKELNPALDRITLTGGEPLDETEKVISIARTAQSLGVRVRLATRGWELNQTLCKELKEVGVTRIQIGLDSSGRREYRDEKGRKWDSSHSWLRADHEGFSKAICGIRNAVAAGVSVSVRYSLAKLNIDDAIDTYAFASTLGVTKFKLRVLFPGGRAMRNLLTQLVSGKELAEVQFSLIQASTKERMQIEVTQPCFFPLPFRCELEQGGFSSNAYKESCPCGTAAAYIDSNGDVKYCLFDQQSLGNVFVDSFVSIWNSETARKARERRCPLDATGSGCSAFEVLYRQFGDFSRFINEYVATAVELSKKFHAQRECA